MNKQVLGKAFKKDQKFVIDALTSLDETTAAKIEKDFEESGETVLENVQGIDGGKATVAKDMVIEMKKKTKKVSGRNFTPSVIEPSFGIGRIMYCLFEHAFYVREGDDENKAVFKLPPQVAPIKCTIFPLVNNAEMNAVSHEIYKSLTKLAVSVKLDTTAISIGKRYCPNGRTQRSVCHHGRPQNHRTHVDAERWHGDCTRERFVRTSAHQSRRGG